jgi:hypothetical protein
MTKRIRKEWQQIMQAHLEFAGADLNEVLIKVTKI